MKICDFLGLEIRILYYTDVKLVGINGKILDETQNSFLILTSNGDKIRLIKKYGVYEIIFKGKHIIIDGYMLKDKLDRRLAKKRCISV